MFYSRQEWARYRAASPYAKVITLTGIIYATREYESEHPNDSLNLPQVRSDNAQAVRELTKWFPVFVREGYCRRGLPCSISAFGKRCKRPSTRSRPTSPSSPTCLTEQPGRVRTGEGARFQRTRKRNLIPPRPRLRAQERGNPRRSRCAASRVAKTASRTTGASRGRGAPQRNHARRRADCQSTVRRGNPTSTT